MKNLDPKRNPVTTILGTIFTTIGVMIFTLPMFLELKHDYTDQWYIPTAFLVSGVAFLVSPDKIIDAIGKLIDKKSGDL